MDKAVFIDNIVIDGWKWLPADKHLEKGIVVKKGDHTIHITDKCIDMYKWPILSKKLGSFEVTHMARIVGYYSKINNWNKSKLGELADRHKGDYVIKNSITN